MKKKELGIIDGQYLVRETSTGDYKDRMDIYTDYGFEIAEVMPYAGNQKANATLIADAFNTANKCGLLPSELFQWNHETLMLLKEIANDTERRYRFTSGTNWPKWYDKAINQIEQ